MAPIAPISIIIPTYNYGHLLTRAITSVCQQSIAVKELIVIDDGSTDHTTDLMQTWLHQANSPPIQYHRQMNQGPGAARNYGTQLASQPWLLFLDADDELLPHAIASYVDAIATHPSIDVFFARTCTIRDNRRHHIRQTAMFAENPLDNARAFLQKGKFSASTSGRMLLKADIARKIPYAQHLKHGEDTVMVALLLANYRCYGLTDVVVNIYSHSGSLRHQYAQAIPDIVNTVDAIFDAPAFPASLYRLKNHYLANRLFSQAKAYIKLKDKKNARAVLWNILKLKPLSFFKMKWMKAYMKSCFI